jgi:glycerol-3-phosphate dehydrogenase
MSEHNSSSFDTTVAIVGGGVAGLWLLNSLQSKGINAWLFEKDQLGSGQTLASQGMIHGGIKYTLTGRHSEISDDLSDMPALWRDCLNGTGPLNLSGTQLRSRDYHLFSSTSLGSRLSAFFGSKAIRARISQIVREEYPEALQHASFGGLVYRLADVVVDVPSLLSTLKARHAQRIFKANISVIADADGQVCGLLADDLTIKADCYLFAAGAGNEALISNTRLSNIRMQRRPLKQVVVTGKLPSLYAHMTSLTAVAKPGITFTTHPAAAGNQSWYLGGNLAETGVSRSNQDQVEFARRELTALFPWIDFAAMQFQVLSIDRAEPAQKQQQLPDTPFVRMSGNVMVCWPTKLTLVPMMANMIDAELDGMTMPTLETAPPGLPPAMVGDLPWND